MTNGAGNPGAVLFPKGRIGMQLFYEGKDITSHVDIVKCIHRDVSCGRSDCLRLELDHAASWYSWEPQQDDEIRVICNGYDTGTLYLNTILPEKGHYSILATSIPSMGQHKTHTGFENKTLDELFAACAAECAMKYALYGPDSGLVYPYLMRNYEGCAAFLNRLMEWEGAALKAVNGRLVGIGILYAQALDAKQTIQITVNQDGVRHIRRNGVKLSSFTIRTPFAESTAVDTDAVQGDAIVLTHLPATDNVMAGRWARGLLLHQNRRAETLRLQSELNAGMTAMARIDIESATDMHGNWLVDEVEHDMIENRTTAQLLRCLTTIG